MANGFVRGVLSTRKQRQSFLYIRVIVSVACAGFAYTYFGGIIGTIAAIILLFLSYLTVAPIIAFTLCFFEWLLRMA
jgi:uncharacterized membrane protein